MMIRFPALLLPALLAIAACSSSPTRFWTIEPVSGLPPPGPTRAIAPVQVAAVHVPLAIDRLEVVQHDEANRVKVLDFDRWSAPPGDLLRRALTQDLVARLPAGSVIYPEAPTPQGARRLSVDVLDVRQVGDQFVMQVGWSFGTPGAVPHALRLTAPAGAGDVAAQAQAFGAMMGDLATAIAADTGTGSN